MRIFFAVALFVSLTVRADPPSPDDMAKIQHEQKAADDEVDKKYGNKKSSELSADERRQMIKEKGEAERKVLEKNNVDTKDYARAQAKQSLNDRAATKAANDKLDKQDADAKAAAAKPAAKKDGAATDTAASDAEEAAAADKAAGYGSKKKGK